MFIMFETCSALNIFCKYIKNIRFINLKYFLVTKIRNILNTF